MADILIRGMEMPKDQHTITITICHDGYTVVEYRDNGLLLKEIETYKTIPLPEGHGRLIDTDALDLAFTDLRFNSDGTLNHWGDRPDWYMYGYEVEKLIADAPTIVPAEGGTDDA